MSEIISRAYDAYVAGMPMKEYIDCMTPEEKGYLHGIIQECDELRNRICA
jgi:hypothetical protein